MDDIPGLIQLREKAEKILATRTRPKQTLTYNDVSKLSQELELNKIELELQTENLQMSLMEIEKLKSKYIDLYDFIPIGYFTLNANGQIIEANEAAAHLFGLKKNSVVGHNISRYILPNHHMAFNEHCHNVLNNASLNTCEIKMLRKDNPIFYGQLTSKSTLNALTGEKYLLTFIVDITECKQKNEYLHHHQNKIAYHDRNISIEKLTSVLAHELNHPLAVIENYLHGCIHRLESNNFVMADIINALKQAAKQTHRAAEVILRMKNFNCNGTLNFEPVNINDLIQQAISLINYEKWDYPITISFQPNKTLPDISIDKIHIEQVIINLARNAIEAMRDAGTSDPRLRIEATQLKKNTIEICVIDNGPGICQYTLHKLFNPYFTTKPYGIGIGLAVCRSIIEAHGGELYVESNHIYGACFKFSLPVSEDISSRKSQMYPNLITSE